MQKNSWQPKGNETLISPIIRELDFNQELQALQLTNTNESETDRFRFLKKTRKNQLHSSQIRALQKERQVTKMQCKNVLSKEEKKGVGLTVWKEFLDFSYKEFYGIV